MARDVEAILKKFDIKTMGQSKNIEKFLELLRDDEELLFIVPTKITVKDVNDEEGESVPGICALTNRRLIFKYKIMFQLTIESITLDKIDNFSCWGNSTLGGHIVINSLSKSYSILVIYKKEKMQLIQETFEAAIENVKTGFVNKNNSDNKKLSVADEIKKFKELLDMGAITEEEFEMKKKELLKS